MLGLPNTMSVIPAPYVYQIRLNLFKGVYNNIKGLSIRLGWCSQIHKQETGYLSSKLEQMLWPQTRINPHELESNFEWDHNLR